MPKSGYWKISQLVSGTKWRIQLYSSPKWTTRSQKLEGFCQERWDVWAICLRGRDAAGCGTLSFSSSFSGSLWLCGGFGDEQQLRLAVFPIFSIINIGLHGAYHRARWKHDSESSAILPLAKKDNNYRYKVIIIKHSDQEKHQHESNRRGRIQIE